jgi:anti-sigma factor RsiW
MGREPTERISDEDLSAYLDGSLPPLRRAQVEAAVRADRQLARRLAAYRAQEASLRQMASTALVEPVPDRLLEVLRRPPAPPARQAQSQPIARPGWRLAAALLLGGAVGWLLHASFQPAEESLLEPFLRQAVLSHELFESSRDPAGLEFADAAGLETVQSPFRTPIRIPQLLGGAWRPVQIRAVEGIDGPGIQIAYLGDTGLTSLLIRQHSAADDLLARFDPSSTVAFAK